MKPATTKDGVASALHDDGSGFGLLYSRYWPAMYALALRLCSDRDAAKDATQEAFLLAYTRLHQLKDAEAFGAWLRRIVVNRCFRARRSESREPERLREHHVSDRMLEDAIDRNYEECARRNRLHAALASLPESLRATMLLRCFSVDPSYEGIALLLGIPVGTVRSRLSDGRRRLARAWRMLEDSNDERSRRDEEWRRFYLDEWDSVYRSTDERSRFLLHFSPDLKVRFASGRNAVGRDVIEQAVEEDLTYGSLSIAEEAQSSGNVTVLEMKNINSDEYPDICPPSSTFVFFREGEKVVRFNLHHALRAAR